MAGTDTQAAIDYRDVEAMRAAIGPEFTAWSNAIEVTQAMIDDFAHLSGDDYWIHTDVERSRRESPYGTTVAHGMLVQSLVGRLQMKMPFEVSGFRNMVNYGSSRLRFPTPVPAGSFIHARSRVRQVKSAPLGTLLTLEIHIHVVGNDRPSVINEVLILYM
jgi:acyl dehydratase